MQRRRLLALILCGGLLIVDQLTKWWAVSSLAGGRRIDFAFGFALELHRNPGAAFSLGSSRTWIFGLVAVVMSLVLGYALLASSSTSSLVASALALSGSVGNLIDRLFRSPGKLSGHVVDFLSVPHYAVCNIADVALTAAAIVMVSSLLIANKSTDTAD